MSDRPAACFIINIDKDQTINKAIINEKQLIMKILKFKQYTKNLEVSETAYDYFDKVFLSYEICYYKYTYKPKFSCQNISKLLKGETILAIFSANSAGCWEHLQVIPMTPTNSNIKYYSHRESITMPS